MKKLVQPNVDFETQPYLFDKTEDRWSGPYPAPLPPIGGPHPALPLPLPPVGGPEPIDPLPSLPPPTLSDWPEPAGTTVIALGDVLDNDGGFTVYIGPDGTATCGIPPAVGPIRYPPIAEGVGQVLDDGGGFTVYIGPDGTAICGIPPAVDPIRYPPIAEGVGQVLDDGGFTIYVGPNGEIICGDPVQKAIDKFVEETTPIAPPVGAAQATSLMGAVDMPNLPAIETAELMVVEKG